MKGTGLYFCAVGLIGVAVSLIITFQWDVRARVLLATEGHFVVQLVSATNTQELVKAGGSYFVSKLVYEKGECIGFLDTGGNFIKLGAKTLNSQRSLWYAWVTYVLFSAFGILFVAGVIMLVLEFLERRLHQKDSG